MRARTAVRDMGTGREAAGLPTSDQSSTQVVSQEAWDEMAGEDVIRPPTPSPKTSDTGKFLVIRLSTKSASVQRAWELGSLSFL